MALSPLFAVSVLVFLIACLVAYWRTFRVGNKYRLPVAVCSLLNSASLVGIILLGLEAREKRTYLAFGLLVLAAAGYLLTEWWNLRLTKQQEDTLEKPKEL